MTNNTKPSATDSVRIAWISDVHLVHRRVKIKKQLDYLRSLFNRNTISKYRAIVCSGDLFDKRIPHDSEEAIQISFWMTDLCELAKEFGVAIVFLHGTPSHDQGQPRWIVAINETIAKIGADVRYYDKITVDKLYPGGPNTLFIPDEMNHSADVTYKEAVEAIKMAGLDQVEVAVMHGMFHYQEPIRTVVSHDEEKYHEIVKHLIIIGHHHTHTKFGIIRVPGSMERLRHNEEEDKGHFETIYSPTLGVLEEEFIVNEKAEIFATINMEGWPLNQVYAHIESLNHYPDGSRLRLEVSRHDEAYSSMPGIKNRFPHFNIEPKPTEMVKLSKEVADLIDRPVMTGIRPDTLKGLVMPRIKGVSAETMKVVESILDEE